MAAYFMVGLDVHDAAAFDTPAVRPGLSLRAGTAQAGVVDRITPRSRA